MDSRSDKINDYSENTLPTYHHVNDDWWKVGEQFEYFEESPTEPDGHETELKMEFERLSRKWKEETFFQSSLSALYTHPAYQRIIGMGRPALPFVLRDLEQSPVRWFYALRFMAGKDVARGIEDFETARKTWLNWGQEQGLL